MIVVIRVFVFLAGSALVATTLFSAVRTMIVPRDEQARVPRFVVRIVRKSFLYLATLAKTPDGRDSIVARTSPTALILLPFVWSALVIAGFVPIFWALGTGWRTSLELSGSSLTTLGFRSSDHLATTLAAVVEALIGLGLIALLIGYLPTIYGHFAEREVAVSQLETRAGYPFRAPEMIVRFFRIGAIDEIQSTWAEWEEWFTRLGESHTTFPMLVFFRSTRPGRRWIDAAGCSLDGAALSLAAVRGAPVPEAGLCLRSGYIALRRIGDSFNVEYDPDPNPDDPIEFPRERFDAWYDELAVAGVPVHADRDRCWADFAGWRVNYEPVLLALDRVSIVPETAAEVQAQLKAERRSRRR